MEIKWSTFQKKSEILYQMSNIISKTNLKFQSRDFKRGDVFSEMFSYWEVIVKNENDILTVIKKTGSKYQLNKFTIDEYVKHCQYSSGHPGYWIDFMKNDINAPEHYIEGLINEQNMTTEDARELKLQLLL